MTKVKSARIDSIDILRGSVMILMALDHVRDYFHYDASQFDPLDLERTTPMLFFTRIITHYCAPVFIFLAGTSAFLYGSNKTKPELFKFLFTRGLWLIILEILLNNLNWSFDFTYSLIILQVIWAIGVSMIFLSFLCFLPQRFILIIGLILVGGHNLLDNITVQGSDLHSIIWYILHQQSGIPINNHMLFFAYPVIPWIGLMALGYCLGSFYTRDFNMLKRRKWLVGLGLGSTLLFFIIRGINNYGDLVPWTLQDTTTKTIMSFFNVTKYPPSLAYILITIGPSLLLLYAFEHAKNKILSFMLVFGRVPFFYYFLHIFVIHLTARIGIILIKEDSMAIFKEIKNKPFMGGLASHGYSLFITYLVWVGIVALLYFPCKKYMLYKTNNKDKWWLSYL